MGAVYEATDQLLNRVVAIKVLKELAGEEVGRKIRVEAQILARLLHENIVRLYDFGVSEGMYFLVMEKVDGPSLFKRWKRVTLGERLAILAQVADALDYAHRQGIIHRDVKPANVLLTSGDQAKLSDFGLSQLAEEATETGSTKGTPQYMSPEQARGKRLDHRTDLYALGVMLYECATGSTPFQGIPMAVMSQHVHTEPEPPRARNSDISHEFEALILALLSKAPESRPSSGALVASKVRELLAAGNYAIGGSPTISVAAIGGTMPAGPVSMAVGPSPAAASMASIAQPAAPSTKRAARSAQDRGLAKRLYESVVAEPVTLGLDDRYLCGHYLAYLLGGSRRKGFLLRRPLDPLNADRARLLLGMTSIVHSGPSDQAIADAALLLESKFDVRPMLSPMLITKYLQARSTPTKRKVFRQARQKLLESSPYAQAAMTDANGVLNPGLMPQVLTDLRRVSPPRTEVDDELVARWNRVTEVWRADPTFRDVVLRYATTRAAEDPASVELWPEVVYPLIERARWQRRLRSGGEVFWDAVSRNVGLPDPGVRLDRAIQKKVPQRDIVELEVELEQFDEDPVLPGDVVAAGEEAPGVNPRVSGTITISAKSFEDIDLDGQDLKELVRLTGPDPIRLTHGELRELHREAVQALQNRQAGGRSVPIGPYRLVVVASVRGRSAGTLAIQGMRNHKQIELLIPSFIGATSATRPVVAVWQYVNNSLAISYLDFKSQERFILWDAQSSQQTNFDSAAALNSAAFQLGLEAPDQLDRALAKNFKPKKPG